MAIRTLLCDHFIIDPKGPADACQNLVDQFLSFHSCFLIYCVTPRRHRGKITTESQRKSSGRGANFHQSDTQSCSEKRNHSAHSAQLCAWSVHIPTSNFVGTKIIKDTCVFECHVCIVELKLDRWQIACWVQWLTVDSMMLWQCLFDQVSICKIMACTVTSLSMCFIFPGIPVHTTASLCLDNIIYVRFAAKLQVAWSADLTFRSLGFWTDRVSHAKGEEKENTRLTFTI